MCQSLSSAWPWTPEDSTAPSIWAHWRHPTQLYEKCPPVRRVAKLAFEKVEPMFKQGHRATPERFAILATHHPSGVLRTDTQALLFITMCSCR